MLEQINKCFYFEVIQEFKPHLVSFGVRSGDDWTRISGILRGVICTGMRRFNDTPKTTSDYRLVLGFEDCPDKFFFVSFFDITSKIQLQSGNKIDIEEFIKDELRETINSGFYNERTEANHPKKPRDDGLILWADDPIEFSYPYNDDFRKLRLMQISYKKTTESIYFKCFCYMRKQVRTFRGDSFNDHIIYNDKTYTLESFLNDVFCFTKEDLLQICKDES